MKIKLSLILILLQSVFIYSQNHIESISKDKSIVYFTRASGLGALINFTYFDGEKAIGKFNGSKYMRYECNSGQHLFWARSENKSFIEADLKAGEIYVIDVIPTMGGLKAQVILLPVDKADYKLKRIQKLISKKEAETFNKADLREIQDDMKDVIARGIKKYNEQKGKGKSFNQLPPEMTVSKNDLIYVKKKKA